MKVVIIGSGAYVTGRGGFGNGTILSSMYQYVKDGGIIDKIIITSPTSKSKLDVINAKENIESRVGMQLPVDFLELESISSLKRCFSEECVDLCIISIPDHLHSMYIKACIESGIAVLVVKPFTDNYEEALSLTEDAEKGGIYCGVEFHKRLDESNLYLKRRIKEGGLGELLYFVVNYSQRISIPTNTFRSWSSKTNIFQYLAYIMLILSIF